MDAQGVRRVQGGKDLKCSQHYPPRFGLAAMEVYMEHYEEVKNEVATMKVQLLEKPKKELKDCLAMQYEN